jgi:hypothetical protein
MIWRPRKGQAVVVRYNKRAARFLPHHGEAAEIVRVARGPGPRNVEVRSARLRRGEISLRGFPSGVRMIVPRENLFAAAKEGRR